MRGKRFRKQIALLLSMLMILSAFGSSFVFAGGGKAADERAAGTITVDFSLFGDEVHGTSGEVHTMTSGNNQAWILHKKVTVPEGSTAQAVFEKALEGTGYKATYSSKGAMTTSYVESIETPAGAVLSEFSNGVNSGWMYSINGKMPDMMHLVTVNDNDEMVFFYTDDYKKEKEPIKIPANPIKPKFNPFDYVTPSAIFEAIKGANVSANQITGDLQGVVESGGNFYAYVNPETYEVNFRKSSYFPKPGANVQIQWISSSAPEYIAVTTGKEERMLRLMKRPVAANNEPAKEVVLTYELTGKNDFKDLPAKRGELKLTIVPGEKIKSCFDYVKEGIFDTMKGQNTSADNITSDLVFPIAKSPAYIAVSDTGALTWKKASYYPHDVRVTFDASSRPDILATPAAGDSAPTGIKLVSKPTVDTDVVISMTLVDRYDASVKESFNLTLKVKGDKAGEKNVLDAITPALLFDAIKGENTAQDAITKDFTLPANGINPFYAKLKADGSFEKWWAVEKGTQIEVNVKSSDKPDLVEVGVDTLKIRKFPTKDTTVNLTFELKDLKNPKNIKTVELPVVIKAKADVLGAITPEMLFDAIKGENTDKAQISKPFAYPADANGCNPFYAKVGDDGKFLRWWGSERSSQVKVELKDTDHPELVKIGTNLLEIQRFPETRTDVKLNFVVSEVANPSVKKTETVTVTLKSQGEINAEKNTAAELQGYLDKYLKPEYISYSQMKKPGVSFVDDYARDNVRYTFNLPNISKLEDLPWKEVKTTVTADKTQDMNVKYKYTCEPVRADVGGKTKTVVLTYTLTKNGCSVSKDFAVKIPALTEAEIDAELALLKDAKAHLFDGLKGKNFDADNVTESLKDTLYEVRYDENGKLAWAQNANEKQYCGLHFPSNEGWDVQYVSGDKGLFHSVNMVLNKRPAVDTKVVATHSIESIQLQRYAEMYKDNAKLQKLKRQNVSIEFTVRKVNADIEELTIAGKNITLKENVKSYSVLTDKTLVATDVKAVPVNKGAEVLVSGTDVSGKFDASLPLKNGFKKFSISVSDADSKNAGTKITNNVEITVASRPYLETEIAKLPQDPKNATRSDVELAEKLWAQFYGLSRDDKASIKGHEKLESYEKLIGDPQSASRKDVEKVASKLFDGIRGKNTDAKNVYTDFEEISYAKLDGDKIIWLKEAKGSDVKIDWISSSAPEYINVHNGNDFETGYVVAFKISKRPQGKALPITFKAKLTHLKDSQVTKDTEVNFTLREYTGNLASLTIDEIADFALKIGQDKYTVEKSKDLKAVTLRIKPEIPNATITVNGQKVKDGLCTVDVSADNTTVKILVNDGVKNTLNDKWAEKEYILEFKNKANQPGPGESVTPPSGETNPPINPPVNPPTGDGETPNPPVDSESGNAGDNQSQSGGQNAQKPAPQVNGQTQNNGTENSQGVQTGDETNMMIPVILIVVCAIAAAVIYIKKRK